MENTARCTVTAVFLKAAEQYQNYIPALDRVITVIPNTGPGLAYGIFYNLLSKLDKKLDTMEFILTNQ